MAMLALKLPKAASNALSVIGVPGTRESSESLHVTMLYLGKDIPVSILAKMMVQAYSIAANFKPFKVSMNRLSCFRNADDEEGYPIICPIESESIQTLHTRLKAAFDDADLEYSNKFPQFKPHCTLSYADHPISDIAIPPVDWDATELVLYGGNKEDTKLIVTMPFSSDVRLGKTASSQGNVTTVLNKYWAIHRVAEKYKMEMLHA